MSIYEDSARDAADLAKLVNEDTDVTTRYGTNPKVSAPKAIRLIETSGTDAVNQIQTDAANAIATLNTSRGFRDVGAFSTGFTYELANDVAIDGSGNYWSYADVNALPVTVPAGTTPTEGEYSQRTWNEASAVVTTAGINAQQFIDNFELKIFQSSTDNLIKVSTFAGGVGVVYEVRKTSDNSLATIYSDKDGVTSIPQNGIANVSNGDAECVFYISDGDYTLTIGGIIAGFVAGDKLYLNVGDYSDSKKSIIASIPRCTNGVFEYLNDSSHEPINVSTIQQPDDYAIDLRYNKDYSKVNTMIVAIDEALAPYGVFCGGSVGTLLTRFTPQAPLEGVVIKSGSGGTFSGSALFDNSDLTISYADDILTITHPVGWPDGCIPIVNQNFNPALASMPRVGVGFTNNSVILTPVTELAGLIRWDGASFVFWSGFPTPMSDTVLGTSVVLSNPSAGILRVTHPEVSDYYVEVNSRGEQYHAKEVGVTATSFDVKFFDYSGAEITTPNSSMQVWVKRKCDVKGKIIDGTRFILKAPLTAPKSERFSNIQGNNFWSLGVMED